MKLTTHTPIADVKSLLRGPIVPMPPGWQGFPNVGEAFRQMFTEAAGNVPPPPNFQFPRGVVICGGGWKFFPSLYVTVKMLRHVGCELPIQVWYLGDAGEFDIRMQQALQNYGVGWINANAFARDHKVPGARILGGWQIKPLAAAYCPFKEVISLDADSYPVYNPEQFMVHKEYARVGAAFWPDQGSGLEPGQWDRFGVARHNEPAWESGQFIVDKGRHWKPLWLSVWMNGYSDYVYVHIYGDKDTFHLCWRKAGHEVCIPTKQPGWNEIAFVQKDFDGRPLFIHRTRDKFRWAGKMDGVDVPQNYTSNQFSANKIVKTLPHDELGHALCVESSELLRPENHFSFRPHTWDREIWSAVNLRNEYNLPRSFSADDVIIDIGGHIGAFAHACLMRGAGHVVTCEPHPDNLIHLRKNLTRWGQKVTIIPAAVWPYPKAYLSPAQDDPRNTGGFSACRPQAGTLEVPTVTLADVLHRAGRSVRLLKIDCEGAEYAILAGVDLSGVKGIKGEAHWMRYNGRLLKAVDLRQYLPSGRWDSRQNGPTTELFNWRSQE